uniref:[RNA-polymerase]-subunit kinase n=1 Tax=Aegilops tauschii subsp. strangulata TaxID=200361 RepID=A0A452Y0N9_AEGTS
MWRRTPRQGRVPRHGARRRRPHPPRVTLEACIRGGDPRDDGAAPGRGKEDTWSRRHPPGLQAGDVMVGFFGGLKVGDFGSAMRAKPAGVPYEECCVGTLIYTSPEQLEGNRYYGQAVDMWALGCIMAEMLAGGTLFVADTEEELLAEIYKLRDQISSTGKLDLEFLEELSEAGREVLTGLLAFNPDKRITAAEALEHRWFSKSPKEQNTLALCR